MRPPVGEWGRRLSDAVREALRDGDLSVARSLVTQGDGQARSLQSEYTYMVRGLGITIRVLMALLGPTVARLDGQAARAATADAANFVRRFGEDIARFAGPADAGGVRSTDAASGATAQAAPALDRAIVGASAAFDTTQAWFDREQGRLTTGILAAIDAGDRARAGRLVDEKEAQYLPPHDRLILFMAQCFGWALRHAGVEGLQRFQLGAAEGQRKGFEKWEGMPAAEFAWTTAFLLKLHMGQVAVTEDDEKFTLVQTPCGSGGRLRLLGAYEGPDALPFVHTNGPLSFGGTSAPVYCSHCPIWNASATLQWFGRAHWVFENPARPDGSCTVQIYKRREDTPPDFVRRVSIEPTQA